MVEDIVADPPIGNQLSIRLRQAKASKLDWVTIVREGGHNTISVAPMGVSPGVYNLVLESFDHGSTEPVTLKTD